MPYEKIGKNLYLEVRTKEQGHEKPHAHAFLKGYRFKKKYNISIDFDGNIIVGSLGRGNRDKEKKAVAYVKEHASELAKLWRRDK